MSNWTFQGSEIETLPDDCIGFVYLITNLVSGKKYIGKKQAFFTRKAMKTVVLKSGVKKKKKVTVKKDSDWKTYFGSNDALNKDVELLGQENFKREILKICKTKTECSYYEAKYQFEFDVLLNPDMYYNSWIMVRVRASNIKETSDEE